MKPANVGRTVLLFILAALATMLWLGQAAPAEADVVIKPDGTFTFAGGTVTSPILFPDGTQAAPSISFSSDPDTGWRWLSSGYVVWGANNGAANIRFGAAGDDLTISGSGRVGFNSLASVATGSMDAFFTRENTAILQLGADAVTAAVDYTLAAPDAITNADIAGGDLTIQSGAGMGTGTVSSMIFQTPTVAAAGANPQALATRLTLSSAGATFDGNITSSGGSTNVAAGGGFHWSGRNWILSPADGTIMFTNNAQTDLDTFRIGPTTPADIGAITLEFTNSGTAGTILTSHTAASGGTDVGFEHRVAGNLGGSPDVHTKWTDNNGGVNLMRLFGDGLLDLAGGSLQTVGTIVSSRTTDVGWNIVTGANTACNTTCTYACVHGWDTSAGEVAVACTDATADKCLCAGPN